MAASTGEERDPLTSAYAERSTQLYEARAALADAVQTLRDELEARRLEADAIHAAGEAIREDHRRLYEQAAEHAALIKRLRDRNAELEAQLDAVQAQLTSLESMSVIRWTALPRRVARRLRSRR